MVWTEAFPQDTKVDCASYVILNAVKDLAVIRADALAVVDSSLRS
jgi:hypothetical protein